MDRKPPLPARDAAAARRPWLLRADNVTPPTRTPWGGRRIASHYKAGLGLDLGEVVGESWEVSVEPSFPSRLAEDGRPLADLIASAPSAWLGPEVARACHGQTPLLVKLLDAADELSLQVHPAMDDPRLASDESGKPESWVIIDAAPGAGIYLGFVEGVGPEDVRRCIETGGQLDQLMNFVPVAVGDAFTLAAGTPHAIGRGCTLIEPQHVAPGKRGLTYRFWDWNRRYDASGRRHADGVGRELHLERALAVTRWEAPRGEAFVATCRESPRALATGPVQHTRLLRSPFYEADWWSGTGTATTPLETMVAVTVLAGAVVLTTDDGEVRVRRGQSAVIPAAARRATLALEAATFTACRSVVAS